MANCILCGERKARRSCPAVNGDICARCCAQEREVKFQCPFSCDYLRESRTHGRVPDGPAVMAHRETEVPLEYVQAYQPVYLFAAGSIVMAAGEFPQVIDADAREAIESLIRTFKAGDSGLIVEMAPENPIAAHLVREFQARRADLDKSLSEHGNTGLRDSDLMKMLIFLVRYLDALSTGRPKCRSFVDSIRLDMGLPVPAPGESKSSLILT